MKTAIITGASSGLGTEFAIEVLEQRKDIEEIWLIARREDKLIEISKKLGGKAKILPLDITKPEALEKYTQILNESKPDVKILINNAGYGKLGNFDTLTPNDNGGMIRLNCEALTVITSLTLPFMTQNSEIINSCSIASFAPNTRMAVYSSTKAYVMSFSRALRSELKPRKINCIAICPGPMDTEFLGVAGIEKGTSHTFDTLPRVNPKTMAEKSLIASKKKKAVYTNLAFYKFYRIVAKLLPHSLVMKMAGT
ncbi:MAG: SDR family NAD(P)-dependent oxidoreductase [Clostridia bacterium]|nr:SDR family NAD(P)-dependent oxidoreductase [Clostridia bacterium]